MKFITTIVQTGNNTGIEVSEQQLELLGGGKKPLVTVTLNGHTYRSAVGKMGAKYLISLSAENRTKAGVKGGDTLEVTIDLDTAPREVEIPQELATAFKKQPKAQSAFNALAPSKKKAIILSITDAKTEETKLRRIEKAIADLTAG